MTKRCHYLSQFYLKNFIDPHNRPYLWVYEKGNPKIRKATAKDIAVRKDYYTFTKISGRRDSETFEKKLAEIESDAAPVFQKITNHTHLTEKDRIDFAAFIAFAMIRVPYFRDKIKSLAELVTKKRIHEVATDPEVFESYVRKFDLQNKIKNQEELRKSLQDGNYQLKISSLVSLKMMPPVAIELLLIFNEMNWHFLLATEKMNFVTSDNPVAYFNQMLDPNSLSDRGFKGGLLNKHTEISFPVSNNVMFLGTWGRLTEYQNYSELKIKHIKEMNSRTIFNAKRFVFASRHSPSLNEVVQRFKNAPPDKEIEIK